jgi:hypothetical protein
VPTALSGGEWPQQIDPCRTGDLARTRGRVGIDTVRYYERNGLLAPRTRLASRYRHYGDLELARLRFIRRERSRSCSPAQRNETSGASSVSLR